jgi:predicted transcriptional regulator of viral defense system
MDYENKVLILNQKNLALELRLAYQTVRNAISKLIKKGFLKKLENGLYLVNPAIACKTSVSKKDGILIQFVKQEEFDEFIESVTKGKSGSNLVNR